MLIFFVGVVCGSIGFIIGYRVCEEYKPCEPEKPRRFKKK